MSDHTVPQSWETTPFPKCLAPTPARGGKLFARDYQASGRFPVIDQGQRQIAGWTDNESLVIQNDLPYVVFGDHTRAFKFVAEPFVLGADGTQLLKPAAQFNPRFFFYACLHLDIPNRGYNRHFTLLKERELPQPTTSEQEKIAAVLWKTQRAQEQVEKLVVSARELKVAAMRRLFSAGLNGELQKETEIGTIPKSWKLMPLGQLAKVGNGSTPKKTNPAYWQKGSFPWLTSAKVYDEVIQNADQFVTTLAAKECHLPLVPADSLVVAITGQGKTLGHVARVAIDTFVSQHLAYITFSDKAVSAEFMRQYLGTRYEHFRQVSQGYGSTKGALTCAFLKSCMVPVPNDPGEQTVIAAALGTIDRKIAVHERRTATLRELFASLLHRLMTGEVRVDNLDIDVSEVRA